MDIISIRNLYFKYNDNVILNNINLDIKEYSFTTIIGKSGKSTLVLILNNKLDYSGEIFISNLELNKRNKKYLNKIISVVDDSFLCDTVFEEITYSIKNLNIDEINRRINNVKKIVNVSFLDKNIHDLSFGEKQIVLFLKSIIIEPKILILDNSLCMVDYVNRKRILKYLKKLVVDKKITVIYITDDIEEVLYGDYLIVLNKEVLFDSTTRDVLKHEKELNDIGIEIPFICRLSNKIRYYNLVDKTYFDMRKLVDDLWK